MLTKQTAYEQIRAYFTRPGAELSRDEVDDFDGIAKCYYRHPDDNRACAIGCLVPDELYRAVWEGLSALAVMDYLPDLLAREDEHFYQTAQALHDNADDVAHFLRRLDVLAADHGLVVPALTDAA